MVLLDLVYAVEIFALGMGFAFLVWAAQMQGHAKALSKSSGYVIIILTLLGLVCTVYSGLLYWSKGYLTDSMIMRCPEDKAMVRIMPGMTEDGHMDTSNSNNK